MRKCIIGYLLLLQQGPCHRVKMSFKEMLNTEHCTMLYFCGAGPVLCSGSPNVSIFTSHDASLACLPLLWAATHILTISRQNYTQGSSDNFHLLIIIWLVMFYARNAVRNPVDMAAVLAAIYAVMLLHVVHCAVCSRPCYMWGMFTFMQWPLCSASLWCYSRSRTL